MSADLIRELRDLLEAFADDIKRDADSHTKARAAIAAADARLAQPVPVPVQAVAQPMLLMGIGKINGDGWKDTTRIGEVIYAWNRPLPEPYSAGQFPRLGNPIWSASTMQYDFRPVADDEAIAVIDRTIEELRMAVASLKDAQRGDNIAAAPAAPTTDAAKEQQA